MQDNLFRFVSMCLIINHALSIIAKIVTKIIVLFYIYKEMLYCGSIPFKGII